MTFLVTTLWPLAVASALLGCLVGMLTGLPRTPAARWGALALVGAAALAGGLAASGVVPGRTGFWLEGGSLGLAAYLIGAGLSAGLAHRIGARPKADRTS
ncbi:hypothetical protein ACLBWX_16170 [Methylobacterium sp. M6A4_1b]